MPRGTGATFVTNDWRQLSAQTNEGFWPMTGGPSDDPSINFEMDEIGACRGGGNVSGNGNPSQDTNSNSNNLRSMAQDIAWLKQDSSQIKNAVMELQRDRDNLRTAVRKLKVENVRMKSKLKRLGDSVKNRGDMEVDPKMVQDVDYDEIGQFLLIGGPKDPLSLAYNDAPIQDANKIEHKSGERLLWYKMAETFDDKEAMQKILTLDDGRKAEETMKAIKNFDQTTWDGLKLKFWEEVQRLKLNQHRWITSLLVKTGNLYLANASQDKLYGTGWRKQRQEAGRPQMWDGENMGGKILMKLRDELTLTHVWNSPTEEQDALRMYNEHRRVTWKPQFKRNIDGRQFKNDGQQSFPPMMQMNYGGNRGRTDAKRRRQW